MFDNHHKYKVIKKIKGLSFWITETVYLLFFLMIFVPREITYKPIKAGLLTLFFGLVLLRALSLCRSPIHLNPRVFYITFFYVLVGVFFVFCGLINNNAGAMDVSTVYVLWPIVYIGLFSSIKTEKVFVGLIRIIVFGAILIDLVGLNKILIVLGILPDYMFFYYGTPVIIPYEGSIIMRIDQTNNMLFMVPFLVAALLTWPVRQSMPVRRCWLWVAIIGATPIILMNGRTVVIFVVLLSFAFTILFQLFFSKEQRRLLKKRNICYLISFGLIIATLNIFLSNIDGFSLHRIFNAFIDGFDFQNNVGQVIRKEQFFVLLDGFTENPGLGAGLGAGVDYIRDALHPWGYELTYMSLIYQVGSVGFICYLAGIGWIFYQGLQIVHENSEFGMYVLPMMVGLACVLVANATNPYLVSFGMLWTLFLPIAFINYYLIHKNYILRAE